MAAAQTAHIKDDKIFYEGTTKISGLSATEVFMRFQKALSITLSNYQRIKDANPGVNTIAVSAETELPSPYTHIKTMLYTLHLTAVKGGYKYKVDSVIVKEQRRGSAAKVRSSKELMEDLEGGGPTRVATEKTLNEIDMNLQKLFVVLQKNIQSGHVVRKEKYSL